MSIIMTAGNKKVEWSPKDDKLVKSASVQGEVKEETNPLYEAAKAVVEAGKKCEKCGEKESECVCEEPKKDEVKKAGKVPGVPDGTGPHGMGKEKGRGEGPCGEGGKESEETAVVDLPPMGSPEGDVIVEPVAEEASEASKMEEAVEKIEEAVVELKEVVEEEKDELPEGEVDEVEIDIGGDDIPGEEVSDSEIIVQSEPCAESPLEGCMAKEKGKVSKSASTEEEFCKFAKLSPANKAKLANYWTNMLGYPKDWVDLLTKDYEK